jgi:hypothetical protein
MVVNTTNKTLNNTNNSNANLLLIKDSSSSAPSPTTKESDLLGEDLLSKSTLTTLISTPPHSPLEQLSNHDSAQTNNNQHKVNQLLGLQVDINSTHTDDLLLFANIQTPPQSAASSSHLALNHHMNPLLSNFNKDDDESIKDLINLQKKLKQNHLKLKENLKFAYKSLRKSQSKYFNQYFNEQLVKLNHKENENQVLSKFDLLTDVNYELEKQKEDQKNELTDDEDEIEEEEYINESMFDSNSEQQLPKSDLFWSMNRVKLGSEWSRVQNKLKLLQSKSKVADQTLNKLKREENEAIQALTNSLKESCQALSPDPGKKESGSSRCQPSTNCNLNTYKPVLKFENNNLLLKSFYLTLLHFKQNTFKTTCLCDENESNNDKKSTNSYYKYCIFCYIFKKNTHVNRSKQSKTAKKHKKNYDKDRKNTELDTNNEVLLDLERVIRADHSYCKELKHPESLQFVTNQEESSELDENLSDGEESKNKSASIENNNKNMNSTYSESDTTTNKRHSLFDYDDDDGLLLDRLVNSSRLNDLFDSYYNMKKRSGKNKISSINAAEQLITLTEGESKRVDYATSNSSSPSLLKSDKSLSNSCITLMSEDDFIDAGLELSLDDLKNLPDFSYDE